MRKSADSFWNVDANSCTDGDDRGQDMYILGISGLYHDSAAALIRDGEIVAAAQEERFTRVKHDLRLPVHAMEYVLKEAGIPADRLEAVVYYDHPFLTMDRFVKNVFYLKQDAGKLIERSFASLASRMWIHRMTADCLGSLGHYGKLLVVQHHVSHAASAFYPSPFERAVILTIDGVGEWDTTTIGIGQGSGLTIKETIRYPHSIGLLYSAVTYFCGFRVNSGEYKLMGLAPYGKPVYYERMKEHLVRFYADGSYALNLAYFEFHRGTVMTNQKFAELFDGPERDAADPITQREMNLASSVQKITEEMILSLVSYAKNKYGTDVDNLVLAGGTALNCVANGKIEQSGIFRNLWIQPAAGDAGGAVGCALYAYYGKFGGRRSVCKEDTQKGSFLGCHFTEQEIEDYLKSVNAVYVKKEGADYYRAIASYLACGSVVGILQGRMEFGPRALGARSILCDPRSASMQSRVNLKIKNRESFRPFAPAVLKECAGAYFTPDKASPYMLLVRQVKKELRQEFDLDALMEGAGGDLIPVVNARRSVIPAVTHVDYSARVQTVEERTNPVFYRILKAFWELTGCGVLVNTSFNVRGEPPVCTPKDAYECFMGTQMDVLVLESFILIRENQPLENRKERYYEPD